MEGRIKSRRLHLLEEIANSVTCGFGLCLSIAGLVILVVLASFHGDAFRVVSFSIYGASLIFLYLTALFYHALQHERAKHVFEIMDHSAVYVLIAGTYTPFMLVTLRGAWGWSLFGVIWSLVVFGIVFKSFHVKRFKVFSNIVYLVMGWLVVIAIQPMIKTLPFGGIAWLLAGGLLYSAGVLFYAFEKLPFGHVVWHLFVLGGSLCHFFSIFFYVLPK